MLAAGYDFSARRTDIHTRRRRHHWERYRYDRSEPGSVKAVVTDSPVAAVADLMTAIDEQERSRRAAGPAAPLHGNQQPENAAGVAADLLGGWGSVALAQG